MFGTDDEDKKKKKKDSSPRGFGGVSGADVASQIAAAFTAFEEAGGGTPMGISTEVQDALDAQQALFEANALADSVEEEDTDTEQDTQNEAISAAAAAASSAALAAGSANEAVQALDLAFGQQAAAVETAQMVQDQRLDLLEARPIDDDAALTAAVAANAADITSNKIIATVRGVDFDIGPILADRAVNVPHLFIAVNAITMTGLATDVFAIRANEEALPDVTGSVDIPDGAHVVVYRSSSDANDYVIYYRHGTVTPREVLANQGANLLYNGTGWLGTTENIVSGTTDNVLSVGADGSFQFDGARSSTGFFQDLIAIRDTDMLNLSGLVKGTDGNAYFGFRFYDANREVIQFHHSTYFTDTPTVLTQPFSSGDTVMHVADASAWQSTGTSTTRAGLAFTPEGGYVVGNAVADELGVTQYAWNNPGSVGSGGGYVVDAVANTITFNEPVTRADYFDDALSWPVGTHVRQPITRGQYRYTLTNHVTTPEYFMTDVPYLPAVDGSTVGIPKDAAFVQVSFLVLRNVTDPTATQNFKDIILTRGPV